MKRLFPILPAIAAALVSGCMSFDVGDPERRTVEYRSETAFIRTLSREAIDVAPTVSQDGAALHVGLKGSIEIRDEVSDVFQRLSLRRQNRMSFGLFPAFVESQGVPKDAMLPLEDMKVETDPRKIEAVRRQFPIDPSQKAVYEAPTGDTYIAHAFEDDLPDLFGILYTPWALLVTPFHGEWECTTHHWCFRAKVHARFVAAYMALPEAERRKLGLNQCDSYSPAGRVAHAPWFGFHRFQRLFPEGPDVSRRETRTRTTRKPVPQVAGPYEIEVEIPSVGYRRRQGVLEGQTEETFFLPSVDAATPADATIRFFASPDEDVSDPDQRSVLEAAKGREFAETVRLQSR